MGLRSGGRFSTIRDPRGFQRQRARAGVFQVRVGPPRSPHLLPFERARPLCQGQSYAPEKHGSTLKRFEHRKGRIWVRL